MGAFLRSGLEMIKLLLVFAVLTALFYGCIVWVTDQMEADFRDDGPRGRTVQVFNDTTMEHVQDMKQRLLFYYWYGE